MYSSASSSAPVHRMRKPVRVWGLVALVFVSFAALLIGTAFHLFYLRSQARWLQN